MTGRPFAPLSEQIFERICTEYLETPPCGSLDSKPSVSGDSTKRRALIGGIFRRGRISRLGWPRHQCTAHRGSRHATAIPVAKAA
jgi:hypothetical protein